MTLKPKANVSIIQFQSRCYKLRIEMAKIRAGMSAEDAIEKIKSMYNPMWRGWPGMVLISMTPTVFLSPL